MKSENINFKSSNNIHNISGVILKPDTNIKIIGIFQICHGMTEHKERYFEFAKFLVSNGFAVCIHDHSGHGSSVGTDGLFGYMGENGSDVLVKDLYRFHQIIKHKIPHIPVFMFGHSMGSFILRRFMILNLKGVGGYILCSTAGSMAITDFGLILNRFLIRFQGGKSQALLFYKFSFDKFNKIFEKKGGNWLTRDEEMLSNIKNDKLSNFVFTHEGYKAVLQLIKAVNCKKWYEKINQNTNILIISGTKDALGEFGRGPKQVHKKLVKSNISNVELKLYKDARHELINETNRIEVYNDILVWLLKNR